MDTPFIPCNEEFSVLRIHLKTLCGLAVALFLTSCASNGGGSTIEVQSSSSGVVVQSSAATAVVAKDYTYARAVNAALGRGVNMGNFLDAQGSEGAWTSGVLIDSAWFPLLKQAGFTSVRIPTRWSDKRVYYDYSSFAIDPTFMAREQQVVKQALGAGLRVIMDIHHFDELTGANNRGIGLDTAVAQFYSMWTQIAAAFQDSSVYPNDKLIFELLNEPYMRITPEIHNALIANVIPLIRATNPYRTLMVGLTSQGKWAAAPALKIPASENNIILTIHFYDPVAFAFQGDPSSNYKTTGVTWGTVNEQRGMTQFYQSIKIGVDTLFPDINGFNGIPVNIGEFGVYKSAPQASGIAWMTNVRTNAEKFGFSWNYWEFCEGYGLYDPYAKAWLADSTTKVPVFLNALIPTP